MGKNKYLREYDRQERRYQWARRRADWWIAVCDRAIKKARQYTKIMSDALEKQKVCVAGYDQEEAGQ